MGRVSSYWWSDGVIASDEIISNCRARRKCKAERSMAVCPFALVGQDIGRKDV